MEGKGGQRPLVADTRWARSLAMLAWLAAVIAVSILYLVSRDHNRFSALSVFWLVLLSALIAAAWAFYVRKSRPPYSPPEKEDAKERVAVLVVHGMGVQDKYQMLDDFARSLPVYTQAYSGKVRRLTGSPKNEYLPLQVGDRQVDVHEAYWGYLFNRLATLPKTLVFAAWTLAKFAPTLFTRFWRKRLAEAAYVGLALALLYVAIASVYSGVVLSSQRFELVQILNKSPSERTEAEVEILSKRRSERQMSRELAPSLLRQDEQAPRTRSTQPLPQQGPPPPPTWRERVDQTLKFAGHALTSGLSIDVWSEAISIEKPRDLLLSARKERLLYSVVYCVAFGLIVLSVLRLVVSQYKFWTAGARGPKSNAEYERRINDNWIDGTWGAIKSGILPLAGILVLDPVLDPLLVHFVATLAILVLVLKGLSWWVINFLGDVMIYATLNANAETYGAREKATDLVASKVRLLLDDAKYERVVVVAHSLGSVIATNAVRRVFYSVHPNFGKLGAHITIGSPLRKFRQLFKAQPYLWSFGDNAITRDGDIFIGEEFEHRGRVPWFNYWYGSDVFADRLAYEPWGQLERDLVDASRTKSQDAYADAVVKAFKTNYEDLDNTGFRVGDRRDCNLGPRPSIWTHSDYWLDHRFVDDLLLMTQCDTQTLKTMSVADKPTLAANARTLRHWLPSGEGDAGKSVGDSTRDLIEAWIRAISGTRALAEALVSGIDLASKYSYYRDRFAAYVADPETSVEAREAALRVNTLSLIELKALEDGLDRCMERFAQTLDGEVRPQCICAVLKEAAKANGGQLPDVANWIELYDQLRCDKNGTRVESGQEDQEQERA